MVGVGDGIAGGFPGFAPGNAADIDEEAHELGNGDRRVSVVELDCRLLGEIERRVVLLDMAA